MEPEEQSYPINPCHTVQPLTSSQPTKAEKRLKRLVRNSQKAKSCRQRKKAKITSLESEVEQLSDQVQRLRAEASALAPVFDGAFGAAVEAFFLNIANLLQMPGNHDEELTAALTEAKEVIHNRKRIEAIRSKFQLTAELMVPEILYCSLNIRPEVQPSLSTHFQGISLEKEQAAQRLCSRYCRAQNPAIREMLETVRTEAVAICHSVDILYARLEGLQPPASSRQAAAFALWLSKYYLTLPIEKVLNYGHNSAEMLSDH
jgi:hypothetical protein